MEIEIILLLCNCLSTFYMIGLIWMVQVVHYPLFKLVGSGGFENYQDQHQKRTTLVVGPPMLIEAFSTILLAWYTPKGIESLPVIVGIALLLVIWLSTAILQVPCHGKLTKGFDPVIHRRLVLSNWIRTLAWSARGALLTWMLIHVLAAN